MLDRSFMTSTRLQESNFVHNLMNNLVQYVNYTKLDLNLGKFSLHIKTTIDLYKGTMDRSKHFTNIRY